MKQLIRSVFQAIQIYPRLLFDTRSKVFVLLYHRILPKFYKDSWGTITSEKVFKDQLDFFAKHCNIISLKELTTPHSLCKRDKKVSIVLTFDDTYWDFYEIAFPVLLQKGIPATFFVVTDFIEGKYPLWDKALLNVLTQKNKEKEISFKNCRWRQRWDEDRLSFALRIFESMKFEMADIRYELLHQLGAEEKQKEPSITWGQAKIMIQKGMEIGSHSQSHGSLSRLLVQNLQLEIGGSKKIIEEKTGISCNCFSIPYGGKKDFNSEVVQVIKDSGYQVCFLNIPDYHYLNQTYFNYHRFIMSEHTLKVFSLMRSHF